MDYIKKGALFPYGGMFQDERYHYTASAVTDLLLFRDPRQSLGIICPREQGDRLLFITRKLSPS